MCHSVNYTTHIYRTLQDIYKTHLNYQLFFIKLSKFSMFTLHQSVNFNIKQQTLSVTSNTTTTTSLYKNFAPFSFLEVLKVNNFCIRLDQCFKYSVQQVFFYNHDFNVDLFQKIISIPDKHLLTCYLY